jgi:hypothetical protein
MSISINNIGTIMSPAFPSVLFIGGSGSVGSRAVRALRRIQPKLPITVAARDLNKAQALTREIGLAESMTIDLERRDLGFPAGVEFSAVVVALKDHSLNSMKFAQDRGVPYISFSDFIFDIAPEVALYVQRPASSAVLLLGQYLGGVVAVSILHFARNFGRIRSIKVGAVFDNDDLGGPVAQQDIERLAHGLPRPLILQNGEWISLDAEQSLRKFIDADGIEREGTTFPLLDVASLSAATGAESIRFDLAIREEASPHGHPSHQVIIEIEGDMPDRPAVRERYEMFDPNVYSALSGYGLALATERMLGLSGDGPVAPGLYHPEQLMKPSYVVERLTEFGTEFRHA